MEQELERHSPAEGSVQERSFRCDSRIANGREVLFFRGYVPESAVIRELYWLMTNARAGDDGSNAHRKLHSKKEPLRQLRLRRRFWARLRTHPLWLQPRWSFAWRPASGRQTMSTPKQSRRLGMSVRKSVLNDRALRYRRSPQNSDKLKPTNDSVLLEYSVSYAKSQRSRANRKIASTITTIKKRRNKLTYQGT